MHPRDNNPDHNRSQGGEQQDASWPTLIISLFGLGLYNFQVQQLPSILYVDFFSKLYYPGFNCHCLDSPPNTRNLGPPNTMALKWSGVVSPTGKCLVEWRQCGSNPVEDTA